MDTFNLGDSYRDKFVITNDVVQVLHWIQLDYFGQHRTVFKGI